MKKNGTAIPLTEEQQRLAEDNFKLAYYFCQKHHVPVEEYLGVASIGLCKAARAFDPGRGFKFATFACLVMKNELRMELRKNKAFRQGVVLVSLDDPIAEDERTTRGDLIPAMGSFEELIDSNVSLKYFIRQLPEREQQIIGLMAAGMTQKRVAQKMGLSQSYISRILKKLQKALNEGKIPKFNPRRASA